MRDFIKESSVSFIITEKANDLSTGSAQVNAFSNLTSEGSLLDQLLLGLEG